MRRSFVLNALLAGLMAIGLCVATSGELAAISDGDVFNAWGLMLFLFLSAAALGLCAGIVETTRFRDLVLTLPNFHWVTPIKEALSRAVRSILSLIRKVTPAGLTVRVRVPHSFHKVHKLPTLIPDLHPSGPAPRILYEPA